MNMSDISSNSESSAEIRELPALYGVDANGKKRMWRCWTERDTVYREHGLVEGKKITSSRTFKGKNIGKKNETTADEQAWVEANKEWIKYLDKKYTPSKNDKIGNVMMGKIVSAKVESGGHNVNSSAAVGARATKTVSRSTSDTQMSKNIDDVIIPMKAEVWSLKDEKDVYSVESKVTKYFSEVSGRGKNAIMQPKKFFGQPKLDGWRARVVIHNEIDPKIIITSNSGKQYPWFESLRKLIMKWLISEDVDRRDILDGLDGELYASELYDTEGKYIEESSRFSTICSICGIARSRPHELEDQIQFHVFDLMDKTGKIPQVERFEMLDRLFSRLPRKAKSRIIQVPTEILSSVEEVPEFHIKYAQLGYEGVVLRTFDNFYKPGKRSPEMRKFKTFIDQEYKIVGCQLDDGVDEEHFVWVLKTDEGKKFNAKPRGTREEKKEWYTFRKQHIGMWLTVRFQEFSEDGVPRFPIAKEFRSGRGSD